MCLTKSASSFHSRSAGLAQSGQTPGPRTCFDRTCDKSSVAENVADRRAEFCDTGATNGALPISVCVLVLVASAVSLASKWKQALLLTGNCSSTLQIGQKKRDEFLPMLPAGPMARNRCDDGWRRDRWQEAQKSKSGHVYGAEEWVSRVQVCVRGRNARAVSTRCEASAAQTTAKPDGSSAQRCTAYCTLPSIAGEIASAARVARHAKVSFH